MTMTADEQWIAWIEENLLLGVPISSISGTMRERGFDNAEIVRALGLGQARMPKEGDPRVDFDEVEARLRKTRAVRLDLPDAEIYQFRKFLSPEDCKKIIDIMRKHLRPSTVVRQEEVGDLYRTSSSCDLGHLHDPFLKKIDQKIADTMGLSPQLTETTQAQYYEVGQEYKVHHDYFVGQDLIDYEGETRGQRTYTFMIYLNTTLAGGATKFTRLNTEFSPRAGTAIIWNNMNRNRTLNEFTEHQAMPVKRGYKAIITKWFRSKIP